MPTFLLLGGYGATGRPLARHLLAQTEADLIIAGRHLEQAQAFVDELASPRVTALRVDASRPADLQSALRGVTMCLVVAPTTSYTAQVARACLEAGVDYLDVQFAASKLNALRALEADILKAGRCFVTEAGYHPGLPSAMVRYAASRMDSLESAVTAGYLNVGDMPYTEAVDELVEAFKDYDARVFKNGAWTKRGGYDMRKFDFGGDVGAKTCYSMFFEEMRSLPELFPTLKETGFYISGSNFITDMLITPIVMVGLKLFPKRGIRPLGKLIWWSMTATKPPYKVVLSVEAKGQRGGRPLQVRARIEHPDGYALTAIPVAGYLRQYLEGSARKPGLWMMGLLAEPVRLMKDMQAMGALFETREME